MKKRKGSVVDILPSMIMVIAAVILITVFFGLYQILSLNEDVKQISRKYMLTMETMGYLDAASRTSLMICIRWWEASCDPETESTSIR